MTLREAYIYILGLLEGYEESHTSRDFQDILTEMTLWTPLWSGETPLDPAYKQDWMNAVRQVTSRDSLDNVQALAAGINFLKFFSNAHHFDLRDPIQFLENKLTAESEVRKTWRGNQLEV